MKKIGARELFTSLEIILKRHLRRQKTQIFRRYGIVLNVQDGIVLASGLKKVGLTELVVFRKGIKGMVSTLEREYVRICLMGPETQIKPGDIISRTKKFITVPVGFPLLGRVVNSLGVPIDGKGSLKKTYFNSNFKTLRNYFLVYAKRKNLSKIKFSVEKDKVINKFNIKKSKKKPKTKYKRNSKRQEKTPTTISLLDDYIKKQKEKNKVVNKEEEKKIKNKSAKKSAKSSKRSN